MATYQTKQKEEILKIISSMNKAFTINELAKILKDRVGLTTIYRIIDKMILNGEITKYIDQTNNTYYQYLPKCHHENHFYLHCEKCGKLIHIDCNCINELTNHISKEHNFIVNKQNIVINGICNNCYK